MRERRYTTTKERFTTTKERFLERRREGIEPEPLVPWWRQRPLFYTLVSLVLVIVAAFTVRGMYRFLPQLDRSGQEQTRTETEVDEMDYNTAKRMFSGEIPAATTELR